MVYLGDFSLHAQMVPGIRAIGEARDLRLDRDQRARDFSIQELDCSVPANVLWPGEQATLKFRLTNQTAGPLSGQGTLKVIHYGTRGKAGDIWEPEFYQIAEIETIPFQVSDLAPKASTEFTVTPKVPETFGGYLLVAELPGHGRSFAASLVRTLRPDSGAVRFPAYALDLNGTSEEVARFFMRTGVKGARAEVGAFMPDDKKFSEKWDRMSQMFKTLKENEITLLVTVSSGEMPLPLGVPRPHLDDDGTFKETKSDYAWLPSADQGFEKWVKDICAQFGWPRGPVNAFELWNEPWEGISISGWGADMLRYREIYTAMAHGIESARREDGAEVLMGGCGSSSNTIDKLFPDGSDTFLKWLDFCSIHYQTMAATPALMRDFVSRENPNGPVRVWDTESWIANSEDRVGLVVASMRAMGQERAMGVYAGNVYEPQAVTLSDGQKKTVVQSWSPAASVAASTKFVGQRRFRELLFQNGLPWIFVFDGRPEHTPDDGTVVVAGDLGGCYSRNLLLFRTVYGLKNGASARESKARLDALPASAPEAERKALSAQVEAAAVLQDGSLEISDGGGRFVLMDFYGNQVPAKSGKITVPLNGYGYYLRTDGSKGSFDRLLAELRKSRIEGYEPVEIVPRDFTARVDTAPILRVAVTNVLNRPISGALSARMSDGSAVRQDLSLAAHETKDVAFKIDGLKPAADNTYPVRIEYDADADGRAVQQDTLRANVISRRAITVDGKLDEWTNVVPQTLAASGIGASLTEKAWLPFSKFDDSATGGLATGYLAYDDKNFYFAARIADGTPDDGMVRFETRDDDQYFYPEVSTRYDDSATFVKYDKAVGNSAFKTQPLQLPGSVERSSIVWESISKGLAVDLNLPANELHQVAFYLLSWDPLGRHTVSIEIIDPATGKVLNRQPVRDFGDGKYVIYNLSGNLRVRILSNSHFLKAVASGIFFDAAKEKKSVNGTTAEFVGVNDFTHGNWPGVFGSEGYWIAGSAEKLPAYAKAVFSTEVKKQELKWPEGVRRYSYRKRPDLPSSGPENHDNVQIAFNVWPADQKPWLPSPPGTPPRWMMYWDTDYEFALNPVAAKYGGGTEIWRLLTRGMPPKHFYPRQPKSPYDGPVKEGKLEIRRDGNTRIVEASIPWSEIPEVRKRLDAREPVKFTFRINDNVGPSYELSTGRSVSKVNSSTFHNHWQTHWANELEFGFED